MKKSQYLVPRWLKIPCVFAVSGVAITTGIARACALWSEPGAFDPHLNAARLRREFFNRSERDPAGREYFITVAYPGLGVQFMNAAVSAPSNSSAGCAPLLPYLGIVRSGWPLPALEGRFEHDFSTGRPAQVSSRYDWSIRARSAMVNTFGLELPRMLPLKPLWPGFVISVLMVSSVLWLSWFTMRQCRRWHRRVRKRCPQCAYPTGRSSTCSECGSRLRDVAAGQVVTRVCGG